MCVCVAACVFVCISQIESAPPPSRSPGNSAAGLLIWCRSSMAGDPHRLLLVYPGVMPPHNPALAGSTPPVLLPTLPPAPLLLHWAKILRPAPWAEAGSGELPVPSKLCQVEPEGPVPPALLLPPVVKLPTPARSRSPLPALMVPTAPAPDDPVTPVGPETATPPAPPLPLPLPPAPAWECAK